MKPINPNLAYHKNETNSSKIQDNDDYLVTFWNMSGLQTITNIDTETKEILYSADILHLCETWITHLNPTLPEPLKHYQSHHKTATKEKSRGRASGGLSIVSQHPFQVIEETNLWIFIKIELNNTTYIFGNVYLKPSLQDKQCILLLQECVSDLIDIYPNVPIIIMGDFNSRLGQLNEVDSYVLESTNITAKRESLDITCNKRGEQLNEKLLYLGFLVLNGRTTGDIPGQFSFMNSNGRSTVDQVWINFHAIDTISKLEIIPVSTSEHSICNLHIKKKHPHENTLPTTKTYTHKEVTKWNEDKMVSFQKSLDMSKLIYFNSPNIDNLQDNLMCALKTAAQDSDMVQHWKTKSSSILRESRPWFNAECLRAKKKVRSSLKQCKKSKFQQEDSISLYILNKKEYQKTLKNEKNKYYLNISEKMCNIKNSKEFWLTVKKIKPNKTNKNSISPESWGHFLRTTYPLRMTDNTVFFDALHPFLDVVISLSELQRCILSAKNDKTPGEDQFTNEFYKHLPPKWEHYLLNMFNVILEEETIPNSWATISLSFLHKKGSKDNPNNYRPIALLNHITKLFTTIIYNRLNDWAEENTILNENQSGFRRNRGPMDNIFSLTAIAHIYLRLRKSRLYAIFVDFKKAFDSILHLLLWENLYKNGVSSKVIRVIKDLYMKAKVKIKSENTTSTTIDVTKGVLQGDSLSPFLFALFINDIEEFFRQNRSKGVNIDGTSDLLMLLFADDIVILGDSPIDVQRKLNILEAYTRYKKLSVNITKTKILVFHRGRQQNMRPFTLNNEEIEVVNKFCYLGISFSSSGKFLEATNQQIAKANMAIGSVSNILISSKSNSWDTKMRLYESIIKSTLLYGAQIWGLHYIEKIETVQLKFLKTLLHCPRSTPNYMLRLETGVRNISISIWKSCLSWWKRLLTMSDTRYPKQLYNRLYKLDQSPFNKPIYNWVTQIRIFLEKTEFTNIWQDPTRLSNSIIIDIVAKHSEMEHLIDVQRMTNTKYSLHYQQLKPNHYISENYLYYKVHIKKIRILSQIRLSSKLGLQIYHRGIKFKLDAQNNCTICNLQKKEDLLHFFLDCPIYAATRANFLASYIRDGEGINTLLTIQDPTKMDNIYQYTTQALYTRSFIMNE